jgi:hypothetical protein
VSKETENQMKNWYEHNLRMDNNGSSKLLINFKLEGRDGKERPKIRWKDVFN